MSAPERPAARVETVRMPEQREETLLGGILGNLLCSGQSVSQAENRVAMVLEQHPERFRLPPGRTFE